MKLSRRGKLARRGKHTKRAGKHLRYKGKSKKFRASKRYHRGNKRTYKRGKRFHRGGEDFEIDFDQSKFDLRYNKHYYTPDTSKFTVTGTINTNDDIKITFRRYDKKSSDIDKTFVITKTSMLINRDEMETWISNDGSKYNFNYPGNIDTLKKINDKISEEIINKMVASDHPTSEERVYISPFDGKKNTGVDLLPPRTTQPNIGSKPASPLSVNSTFLGDVAREDSTRESYASEAKAAAETKAATEAKAAAQLKPINDGSLKNNHKDYNPPRYIQISFFSKYDYDNYLGRYTLKFNGFDNQTFDVYFIGSSTRPYNGGFIYLFGVTDADTMQGKKLVYNSGYYIMTSMLISNKNGKNNFLKMIKAYDYGSKSEKQQYTLEDFSFIDSIDKKLQKIEKGIEL